MSFQLLAVNLQCFFFTDWSCSQTNFLRAGNLSFQSGLVISLPVSWRDGDCCGGVTLRAQLGVNDIAWARRQTLSRRPLISSAASFTDTELCKGSGRWVAVGGPYNISSCEEERWLTSIVPLSYDACEQDQVAGIIYINHMAISAPFQVWRCETIPKASAIFLNIPLTLWKVY